MRPEIKERIAMIARGEVPKGYKKIGHQMLPENWNVRKVKTLSKNIVAGATPNTNNPVYWDGDIPWMSSGEINNRFIYRTERTITHDGYDNASTKLIPPNSILIALAGQGQTRGRVAINRIELCTNQSLASIISNDKIELYICSIISKANMKN
jgi:type I restriction enzyme, S subunit